MADVVTVTVSGLQALGEKMRGLAMDMNLRVAQKAVNAGARVIKRQAIANAPQYPVLHRLQIGGKGSTTYVDVPPGNLKANIVAKKIKDQYTASAIVTVRGKRKDNYAARYGRLVEYGTVNMAPEPYLRTAFDQEKGFAVGEIKRTLTVEIGKASK